MGVCVTSTSASQDYENGFFLYLFLCCIDLIIPTRRSCVSNSSRDFGLSSRPASDV